MPLRVRSDWSSGRLVGECCLLIVLPSGITLNDTAVCTLQYYSMSIPVGARSRLSDLRCHGNIDLVLLLCRRRLIAGRRLALHTYGGALTAAKRKWPMHMHRADTRGLGSTSCKEQMRSVREFRSVRTEPGLPSRLRGGRCY